MTSFGKFIAKCWWLTDEQKFKVELLHEKVLEMNKKNKTKSLTKKLIITGTREGECVGFSIDDHTTGKNFAAYSADSGVVSASGGDKAALAQVIGMMVINAMERAKDINQAGEPDGES